MGPASDSPKSSQASSMRQVAREAGVSVATVSRVFSNGSLVKLETRQRVLEAAARLGYMPIRRRSRRSVRAEVRGQAAILVPRRIAALPSERFYVDIARGLDQELRASGFGTVFVVVERAQEALDRLASFHDAVLGVVLMGTDWSPDVARVLCRAGLAVVLVDHFDPDFDCILPDHREGGFKAAQYLASFGYSRFAYVCESLADPSFAQRLEGFQAALEQAGVASPDMLVLEVGRQYDRIQDTVRAVLTWGKGDHLMPTAVFAGNDTTAIAFMSAVQAAGVRVPEDVAVVGFDDDPMSSVTSPPLTTIRVARHDMGCLAAARLVDRIRHPERPPLRVFLSVSLVVRQSTPRVPGTHGQAG